MKTAIILNSVGEGIYGLDSQGKITFVNSAAARMLGYQMEELTSSIPNRDLDSRPIYILPECLNGSDEQFMHAIVNHSKSDGTPYSWAENPICATLETGAVQYITNDIFRKTKK